MQLKIDMERFSGQKTTVKYDNFYLETQVLHCTEFSTPMSLLTVPVF